jgi:N-acetylglucosamine-6-sulfatase
MEEYVRMYTSDNGFQLGQHRLGSDKRQLYAHDIRVPFIVTGPGVPSNTHDYNNHIVMNIDIAPTIYHLVTGTSSPLPANMDGSSIAPFMLANNNTNRNKTTPSPGASIESRHDFLVSYHGEGYPPCGMGNYPPPEPPNSHGGDASNNTNHCLPTMIMTPEKEDSVSCHFQDDEDFVEFFDLTEDQCPLANTYDRLSQEEKGWYEKRLSQSWSCRGPSCRESPKRESISSTLPKQP